MHVSVEGPLVVNDLNLILSAILGGGGIACLPDTLITQHIETDRLVPVLQEWCRPISGFFLYYPCHRHTPVALRTLIDFLRLDSNAPTLSGVESERQ
jgi:DNA-binding transcriptional LysR family regulator